MFALRCRCTQLFWRRLSVPMCSSPPPRWLIGDLPKLQVKKSRRGKTACRVLSGLKTQTFLADVAFSTRAQAGALYCVGFAAETQYLQAQAQAKRVRKGVPLMVGNLGPATFGQDDNALLVIDEQGALELPLASKLTLARQLMAEIASRISTKGQL